LAPDNENIGFSCRPAEPKRANAPAWLAALAAVVVAVVAAPGFGESPRSPAEQALARPDPAQPPDAQAEPTRPEPLLPNGPWGPSDTGVACGPRPPLRNEYFDQWHLSASWLTGYIGINLGPKTWVPFSMMPELFRLNMVMWPPRPGWLLGGSGEWLLELDTIPVVDGPARVVIGGSSIGRYNFLTHKERRWVCYFQFGEGVMYTDAVRRHAGVLSTGFEFILQTGVGMNIYLTDRWAFTAEWMAYHFSNGGIVKPNVSVNMMGGLFGLTYHFGR
jgi:hypothetical protein